MTKHPARQKRTKQVIGRVRTADNPSIFSKLLMEVSSCTETMPSRQVTGLLMSISDAELSDVQPGRLICGVYANTGYLPTEPELFMKVAISAFDSLNAMYQNTIAFLIRTASEHTDRPKQKAGK